MHLGTTVMCMLADVAGPGRGASMFADDAGPGRGASMFGKRVT